MFWSAKFYIFLLNLVIKMFFFPICAVSGKLVLAREYESSANTSRVERINYESRPFGSTMQTHFRLPISTTVKTEQTIIRNDGKY